MKTKNKLMIGAAICSLAFIYNQPTNASEEITGFVALGGLYKAEYEGSEDYEVMPFGAGRIEYGDYYLESRGPGIRANLSTFEHFEFGPSFYYRGERDNDVENDAVSRLRDIDGAFEVGGFARVKTNGALHPTDELALEVDVLWDVSDAHQGTVVKFGPSYGYSPSEKWRIGTSLAATYVTDDYSETYFGIDANNAARSGLNQFDAEGGIKDIDFTVTANYTLNDRWGITGLAGYTQLLGDAADSPIVDDEGDSSQFMFGTGISYHF